MEKKKSASMFEIDISDLETKISNAITFFLFLFQIYILDLLRKKKSIRIEIRSILNIGKKKDIK